MPKYQYTAQDEAGKKVKGEREAADEKDLYQRLRQEGLFLMNQKEKRDGQVRKKIKTKDLADFCRELATLLEAGVSLVRALGIISEEENIKKNHRIIYSDLQKLIRQGVALSDAMEQQGDAFPELMIHMFRSAEASGKMDQTAFRMATHYEKQAKLKSKVSGAMVYPCILLCMIVAVVLIIFTFVLPQFDEMFSQMESLPASTEFLMWLSDQLINNWLQIGIGFFILVMVIIMIFRIYKVRLIRDRILVHMPVVGKLLMTIYTARFARTLSSLYSSGLPIVTALQTGRKTVGNLYIDEQFDQAIAGVRAGANLSAAVGGIDGFVKKFASTILIGEETGSLDSMLDSSAENLEYESEMAINKLVSLLEPLMIVIMALIVGFIIISVITPIYGSYDAIGAGY